MESDDAVCPRPVHSLDAFEPCVHDDVVHVVAALFGTAFTSIMNLNTNIVAVNGALGKGAVDMVGMFNNMSMLAIAIIGFALSLLYYKNNQRPVAAAGAAEGDDDDEL